MEEIKNDVPESTTTENDVSTIIEDRDTITPEQEPARQTEAAPPDPIEEHATGQAEEAPAETETEEAAAETETEEEPTTPHPDLATMAERACQALVNHGGMNDEETVTMSRLLQSLASDMQGGAISTSTIDTLLLALRHDADVENARREGEVEGRNAKIDEWKEQRRSIAGIHQLGNSVGTPRQQIPLARLGGLSAADRQNIWERGNERRVRY